MLSTVITNFNGSTWYWVLVQSRTLTNDLSVLRFPVLMEINIRQVPLDTASGIPNCNTFPKQTNRTVCVVPMFSGGFEKQQYSVASFEWCLHFLIRMQPVKGRLSQTLISIVMLLFCSIHVLVKTWRKDRLSTVAMMDAWPQCSKSGSFVAFHEHV